MTRRQENHLIVGILAALAIAGVVIRHRISLPQDVPVAEAAVEEIVIGAVDSMTGPEASFGNETINGIRMGFDQVNAQGGINNRRVHVRALDDQGKPEEAATAVTNLIDQAHAVAIIGAAASSRTFAIAPIAQSRGVPLVTPGATNPKITGIGDHIFRVCFIDDYQGAFMAELAVTKLAAKRLAILTDVKSDYSVGLSDWFAKKAESLGAKIVSRQSYTAGDLDFRSQLTALRSKKLDAIFLPGYYTEVGLIIRQAKELGIKARLLGGDGWDSPRLTEIAADAAEGSLFSNHFASAGEISDHVRTFVDEYTKLFGRAPGSSAALGYDAALVVADALRRAKTIDRDGVTEALGSVKDIQGVTGTITIGPDRNAIKEAILIKVEGGKFLTYKLP